MGEKRGFDPGDRVMNYVDFRKGEVVKSGESVYDREMNFAGMVPVRWDNSSKVQRVNPTYLIHENN